MVKWSTNININILDLHTNKDGNRPLQWLSGGCLHGECLSGQGLFYFEGVGVSVDSP